MTSRATNRRREDVQCVPHASSSDGAVLRGARTLVALACGLSGRDLCGTGKEEC